MVRYGTVGILFCIYLAGSVWLVRNEGQTYRESLRRTKSMENAGGSHPAEPDPQVEIANAEDLGGKREQPQRNTPSNKPPADIGASSSASEGQDPAEPSRSAATNARSTAAPVPPSQTSSPRPPRPEATSAALTGQDLAAGLARWKNDPFWSQPQLVKAWDLDALTTQGEKQLGEQLNRLILQLNSEDSGSGLRRVKEAARPLLEHVSRKDLEYQFFVMNSDVVNAYSHPGGYVYVSRKLLDMIPEDDEHLLEFVLGHEIAHVDLRHALTCLRDPDVQSFSEGTLQKLYFLIIPYGYPAKLEFAADAWVYQRMKRLGKSEHDCLNFLRKLDGYAKAHGFDGGRGKPGDLFKELRGDKDAVRELSPIDNHLRSHPAAFERLNHLKGLKGETSKVPK